MIRYAVLDASGLVVGVGVAQSAALVAKAPSESVFEIDAQDPRKIEPDRYAIQAGALVATPEKTAGHLVWSGGAWVDMRSQTEIDAAAELALLSARTDAFDQLTQRLDDFAFSLTGSVPMSEKLSWATKEIAARAHIAGTADAAQTTLLQGEASFTGETLNELSGAIVQRADAYRVATAAIAGLRRKYLVALDAATDVSGIEAAMSDLESEITIL